MGYKAPRQGDIYRHFKGKLYQIVAIAFHADTEERQVVYQALYGDFKTYIRSYDNFTCVLDKEMYPDATQEYRFEYVPMAYNLDDEAEIDEILTKAQNEEQQEVLKEEPKGEPIKGQGEASQETPEVKKATEQTEHAVHAINMHEITNDQSPSAAVVAEETHVKMNTPAKELVTTETFQQQEEQVDPDLLAFLDADGNAEKIEVLYTIRKKMTENMMSAIEASLEIPRTEGTIDERIMLVRNHLATRARFEGTRLR